MVFLSVKVSAIKGQKKRLYLPIPPDFITFAPLFIIQKMKGVIGV